MQLLITEIIVTSTIYLLTLSTLVWSGEDCHCGLPGTPVSFKTCRRRPALWKPHDDPDIGLTGSCLPQVPVNTMKCFKWRTADRCETGHPLRCSLKHRTITLEKEVSVTPDDQSATLFSPSFQNQSFYRNNNFCVYNISLDCPGKIVSLTSKLADYGLADAATCQDYLWFDTSFYGQSQKICGDEIRKFKDSVHTQSFIAILWTNENNSEGKFEVEARCTDQYIPAEPEYSGSNPLLSNEQ